MTENANPTLGKAEDLFKSLVWDNLVSGALTMLFAAAPFLAFFPIALVVGIIVRFFAGKLFEALRLAIDLEAIVFLNEAHRRAYDNAAVTLVIVEKDKGLDSEEYRKVKEDAKAALAKYVHFNGS